MRDIKRLRGKLKNLNEFTQAKDNLAQSHAIEVQLNDLLKKKETYWAQRSRPSCYQKGTNTQNFSIQTANERRKVNNIQKLVDDEGETFVEEIYDVLTNYISNLFTSLNRIDMDDITNLVCDKVKEEDRLALGGGFQSL